MYECPYLGQHGIALLMEAQRGSDTRSILIDVAQHPEALISNMEMMRIDASAIDALVLTHCHYDHTQGVVSILKKIGEEATETVMAAKDGEAQKIVYEVADLWFHTLVLLAQQGLGPDAVLQELDRRFGLSGLEEKASRKQS